MRGLCSRTSVDDEDDVADFKVDGDLGATTLVSHERHLSVLAHVRRSRRLPEPPFQLRCGSRRLWTGIRKLRSTTTCSGGDSLLLCSPSGGHAGVREGEGSGLGCGWRPGGGGGQLREEGLVELCVLSSQGPIYIVGRGAPLPLPKASKGGGQGGGGRRRPRLRPSRPPKP
jgi:hypothetical protein